MSKGSQTTTQQTSTSPPSYVADAYKQYIQQIQGVNQQPYVPYTGEGVAPINAQQTAGIGGVNTYANAAQPAYAQGLGLISGAANPLSAAQIQQYYDPYNQDVIKSTTDWLNQQNATQQQQVLGNAAAQGALGGDRVGITQAALAGQQQKAEAPIIAGLESAGYNQAVQYAMQQFQQNPMAAAYGLGNLGAGSQAAGLQGAGAQISAGTLQQQTQQAQDQYNYSQYLQAQGFPYQEAQWYASQLAGVGSLAGGTTQGTTTAPPPSLFGQILGLGTAGAAAYGAYQSAQKPTATGATGGRIKGYQTGGSPYGVAGGYVPAANTGHGPGPPQPHAPAAPGQQGGTGGASSMFGEAQNLASMGKAGQGVGSWLGGLGGGSAMAPATGDIVGAEAGAGVGDVATGVAGDAALSLADVGLPAVAEGGDAALAMLALLQRGGRVQLPMRAGMGMPSFVRGYQEGGSPETDIGTYNDTSLPMWKRVGLSGPPSDDAAATEEALGRRYMASDVANAAYVGGPSPMAFSGDGQPTGGLQAPPPEQQAYQPSYQPPPRLPPSARPQVVPGQGGQGFLGMSPEFWQSLMAAGLGTAAAASRPGATPLGSIGEGGIFGLKTYGGLKGKEADIEMESRKLDQQAQAEQDQLAIQSEQLAETKKYRQFEMSKPVPSGTAIDQFGNRIQTYSQVGPDGKLHPISGEPGTAGQPGTSTFSGGINSSLTGEEYLKQFPPETQAAVKDYLAGRTMPTGNPRTGPAMMIKQIAQKYGAEIGMRADDAAFAERRQMKTDLARTSPQSLGGQLTFAGTAISHLADGAEAMVGLNNYDALGIPGAAWAINKARGAASTEQQGAVNRVNGVTQHYGQEITKYYANSPGGEAERNRFNNTMDTSQSPMAAAGSIRAERDLIPERTQQQYANMVHVLGQQEADAQISRLKVPEQTARINASIAKLDPNGPEAKGIRDGTITPVSAPSTVKNSADVRAWAQQNRVPSGYPVQLPDGSTVRAP